MTSMLIHQTKPKSSGVATLSVTVIVRPARLRAIPCRTSIQPCPHGALISPSPSGTHPPPHDSAQRIFNQRCTKPPLPHTPISASLASSNRTAIASTAGCPSRSTTSSAKPSDIMCSAVSRGIPRLSR